MINDGYFLNQLPLSGTLPKFYDDLTTRNHSEVPQLDLYICGFPCQSFSIAGKRGGFDDVRGTVFFSVAEFIKLNQPKAFILENVKGLLSHDKGRTHNTIVELLSNNGGTVNGQMGFDYYDDGLGYHIYWQVLNTKEYGIPQNRERWFCVGFKEPRKYGFPIPFTLKLRLKDLLEPEVDEKYYLSDNMIRALTNPNPGFIDRFIPNNGSENANCLTGRYHKMAPTDTYIIDEPPKDKAIIIGNIYPSAGENGDIIDPEGISKTLKSGETSNPNHGGIGSSNAPKIIEPKVSQLNESKESGGQQPYQQNRIYDKEGISPAIQSELGGERSHNINTSRIRRLTPLECLRLQDFPDEFHSQLVKIRISDTQIYRMAGNSMSVNVITGVIKNI